MSAALCAHWLGVEYATHSLWISGHSAFGPDHRAAPATASVLRETEADTWEGGQSDPKDPIMMTSPAFDTQPRWGLKGPEAQCLQKTPEARPLRCG